MTVHNRTIEWVHTLGDVVSAIIAAGLRIGFLHEHPQTLFRLFPWLTTQATRTSCHRRCRRSP